MQKKSKVVNKKTQQLSVCRRSFYLVTQASAFQIVVLIIIIIIMDVCVLDACMSENEKGDDHDGLNINKNNDDGNNLVKSPCTPCFFSN